MFERQYNIFKQSDFWGMGGGGVKMVKITTKPWFYFKRRVSDIVNIHVNQSLNLPICQ